MRDLRRALLGLALIFGCDGDGDEPLEEGDDSTTSVGSTTTSNGQSTTANGGSTAGTVGGSGSSAGSSGGTSAGSSGGSTDAGSGSSGGTCGTECSAQCLDVSGAWRAVNPGTFQSGFPGYRFELTQHADAAPPIIAQHCSVIFNGGSYVSVTGTIHGFPFDAGAYDPDERHLCIRDDMGYDLYTATLTGECDRMVDGLFATEGSSNPFEAVREELLEE